MSIEDGRPHKRQKKTEASLSLSPSPSLCGLYSLPDDVALNCMFRLSRFDRAALSLTSKSYRSLVVSPELCRIRSLIGCTEEYYYVCLKFSPNPTPRWFILRRGGQMLDDAAAKKSVNRRLKPIPSHPCQSQIPVSSLMRSWPGVYESSSYVVLDNGIYIIGGIIKRNPTSEVWLLDCLSHTWRRLPSMRLARASAVANVVDGKIYVFGGCQDVDSSDWAEVFDPKTQSWDALPMPENPEIRMKMIKKSVVMEDKVYAVNDENQSFYYLPSEGIWRRGNRDSMRGNRNGWCAIGKLLYCCASRWRILWCDPDELDWKEVQGLDVERWCMHGSDMSKLDPYLTTDGFSRMSCTSRGNIVVFWKVPLPHFEMELWCAEIALERREGGEIWGKIVWDDVVFELDSSHTINVTVSYSASVNI